jgi:nitrite reductase (NADH) small subunit
VRALFPFGSDGASPPRARGNMLGEVCREGPAREGRKHVESMPRFVKLATLHELPVGSAREVEFEGRIYALYNIDGVISAIDGICPHQGGPLADGLVEGTTVTCPWHGWQFDVRSGKTPLGPKITQPVYDVRIEGEDVLVAVP